MTFSFHKYTSHTWDSFVLSAFRASLPVKRDQKFAFTSSSSHSAESENCDFDKGKDGIVNFFGMYLLFHYKAIGGLKNFGERCQNLRFTGNK